MLRRCGARTPGAEMRRGQRYVREVLLGLELPVQTGASVQQVIENRAGFRAAAGASLILAGEPGG